MLSMRRLELIARGLAAVSAVTCCSWGSSLFAGSDPAPLVVKQQITVGRGPKISFSEYEYDFGKIPQQSKVSHTFVVKNTGDAPLQISSARGSCGCTAAVVSDGLIVPGGEGKIEVTFNSGHRRGQQTKTITVNSNDPETSAVLLRIAAFVDVSFGFESSGLDMEKLRPEQTMSKKAYIKLKEPGGATVKNIRTSSEFVEARVVDDPESVSGGRIPIEIRVKPGLPLGYFNNSVTVTPSVDTLPSATIRVYGTIVGDIEISPESVRFIVMKNADNSVLPSQEKVTIMNHSLGRALGIVRVFDPDGKLDIETQRVREGEEYLLLIRPINPAELTLDHAGAIVITTDDPELGDLLVHYEIVRD